MVIPFESKKQEIWLKLNRPDIYKKWLNKYGHHPNTKVHTGVGSGRKKKRKKKRRRTKRKKKKT